MILKALYDYYERSEDLAPEGMEYKEIAFLLIIDEQGHFVRLENCMEDNRKGRVFLVPKSVSRSSNPVANICWDNPSYVLGLSEADLPMKSIPENPEKLAKEEEKRKKEQEKNGRNNAVFLDKIRQLYQVLPHNRVIQAVLHFYDKSRDELLKELQADVQWEVFCKNLTRNVSFRLDGDLSIVPEDTELNGWLQSVKKADDTAENRQICLVTGERAPIVDTTKATPIMGSQAIAKLVAFQVKSGYDSYGKSKGANAPISKEAEFKYTTALNHLLGKESKNLFRVGNRSYVFWASSSSTSSVEVEQNFFSFLTAGLHKEKHPDQHVDQVEKVFKAVFSGTLKTADDDRFYILGLAPNAARIAVVYWKEIPVREFAGNLLRHFEDMEIIDTRLEHKPYKGLYQMMQAVTLQGKASEVQPNLPESVIRSILQGSPYPYSLYMACLRRIRAEQQITQTRMAILKAYLNRQSNHYQKITVMLDENNTNVGYLCGRLFATLEYLQKRSSGTETIRSRYMNAASSTPTAVFSTLLNLSVHHENKLDKGTQIFFQQTKDQILQLLSAQGFPTHLSLQDQGRFFVGYHHQRADFYKAKEEKNNTEE